MTALQYDFLSRYRDSGFLFPDSLSPDDHAIFLSCKSDRFVRCAVLPDGTWAFRISESGLSAMLSHEDHLLRQAEEDAKRKSADQSKEKTEDE